MSSLSNWILPGREAGKDRWASPACCGQDVYKGPGSGVCSGQWSRSGSAPRGKVTALQPAHTVGTGLWLLFGTLGSCGSACGQVRLGLEISEDGQRSCQLQVFCADLCVTPVGGGGEGIWGHLLDLELGQVGSQYKKNG